MVGVPSKPAGQRHTGRCWSTWQKAPTAHAPSYEQGFTHSWLRHERSKGQSSSRRHSAGGRGAGMRDTVATKGRCVSRGHRAGSSESQNQGL